MIKIYNDCKGKPQSYEASLTLNKGGVNGHSSVDIYGYGASEIEAVHNLRMNAKDLVIDLLLALEGETQRSDRAGNLLTEEESIEFLKCLKQI